jgi:hypothetical protein
MLNVWTSGGHSKELYVRSTAIQCGPARLQPLPGTICPAVLSGIEQDGQLRPHGVQEQLSIHVDEDLLGGFRLWG